MKLASIIVTYHPNVSVVINNITAFANNIDLLLVWDNSEQSIDLKPIKDLFPNANIHHDGRNQGLPIAYNWAIKVALEHGCSHLMTMDQDSTFVNFYNYRLQLNHFKDPCTGIFTCPVNNDISHSEYRKTTVCQSGSVYSLNMIQSIGGFREDLFIGMVDAEMSLRAMEKGYRIYQIADCNLIQHIGSGRKVTFLGKIISVSDYSPLRHYYDSRNRILLWYEFPYDYSVKGKINHLISRIKVIIKIMLFESNKWNKTHAIIRGTWYGLLNRTIPFHT